MPKQVIERRRNGRSFQYFLDGRQITAKGELDYFKSLGTPPAWKEVKISVNRRARILVTGLDRAGRLQYIYHPAFRARQDREKFERTLRFARTLPKMRRVTSQHLKEPGLGANKVYATIVQLMDKAYFRVGNDEYAQQNQSYGLTTMRSKHTEVKGDTIIFDFIGKSGKEHHKRVTDPNLARVVKQLDNLPGYEVFKYYGEDGRLRRVHSEDVNAYIKEIMGEEFSAKDFRTWGGTLIATAELASAERAPSLRERQKTVTDCVKAVAQKLGNTPAIALNSYIDPRVIKAFVHSDELSKVQKSIEKLTRTPYLSREEECVLQLLEKAA